MEDFADDQGMVVGTEMWLQRLMNKLNDTAENFGMTIHVQENKNHGISLKRRWCC